MTHLIFFDDECSFCQRSVKQIIHLDKKRLFVFAPLKGEVANRILSGDKEGLKKENSLILVEEYKSDSASVWLRGRAVFRILWLEGGLWKLIGWLYLIPFGIDALYRVIARHRQVLSPKSKTGWTEDETKRFLN